MQVTGYFSLHKGLTGLVWRLWRALLLVGVPVILFYLGYQQRAALLAAGALSLPPWSWRWLLPLVTGLLVAANWYLEALKWQIVAAVYGLNIHQALKGVISGVALDNLLPAGSGAVAGRLAFLPPGRKIAAVPGILAAQLLQSVVTLAFGWWSISSMALPHHFDTALSVYDAWWPLAAVVPLPFVVVWRQQIRSFLQPLKSISLLQWGQLFFLSLGRYLVFAGQFVLLAAFFAPAVSPAMSAACAAWMFVARTFVPKVSGLERLGIRTLAVIMFAGWYELSAGGLLLSMVTLWLFNLALPSLAGAWILRHTRRPA